MEIYWEIPAAILPQRLILRKEIHNLYPSPLTLQRCWLFSQSTSHRQSMLRPVAFESAWVLATLAALNHRVHLCSGASLTFCLNATSSVLGIDAFRSLPPCKVTSLGYISIKMSILLSMQTEKTEHLTSPF